jgi:hypothetical protein
MPLRFLLPLIDYLATWNYSLWPRSLALACWLFPIPLRYFERISASTDSSCDRGADGHAMNL